MFSTILVKAIQVGEKTFHILCDMSTNPDELEKLGLEVIKVSQQIKTELQNQQASQQPEQTAEKASETQPKAQDGI